jgi:hypothetical protein
MKYLLKTFFFILTGFWFSIDRILVKRFFLILQNYKKVIKFE